jgi:hypothetical protein
MFKAEQLDQLLAPIALYPDALLAQILMAATYPLEVVKADRWLQDPAHANLQGDQLAAAIEAEAWEPSVKSLVPFPRILRMMDGELDWMEQLGNAVVAQQGDVMDAIQRLRHQAAATGTLWSNAEQQVTTELSATRYFSTRLRRRFPAAFRYRVRCGVCGRPTAVALVRLRLGAASNSTRHREVQYPQSPPGRNRNEHLAARPRAPDQCL